MSKWRVEKHDASQNDTLAYRVLEEDRYLSFSNVLDYWQKHDDFCRFFSQLIAQSPYPALYWETPPWTKEGIGVPFEFVLIKSHSLERIDANFGAFREYFAEKEEDVKSFPNLGGDAWLVVPSSLTGEASYPHVAEFMRKAPSSQTVTLWKEVACVLEKRISSKPLWLSTAGNGVPWLHIRVDQKPKYYHYTPYASWA